MCLEYTKEWIKSNFGTEASIPPFSFKYGGRSSIDMLKEWKIERAYKEIDESRLQQIITYTDPDTNLKVRCVIIEYHDFPTVEWTLYFKNTGSLDTPIISDIHALNISIKPHHESEFLLHHNVGSLCKPYDYQPLVTKLHANSRKRITAAGGRPTNSDMCYFNLESTAGNGLILAIGWPGQWAAEFNCHEDSYIIKNMDTSGTIEASGSELIEKGTLVNIPDRPGAVVITYNTINVK
jgi:alpha-galactosidase